MFLPGLESGGVYVCVCVGGGGGELLKEKILQFKSLPFNLRCMGTWQIISAILPRGTTFVTAFLFG